MRVKLLKDIARSGGSVEVTVRRGRIPVYWEKGTIVEMSDVSAQKFIERREAERYDGPAPTDAG